MILIIKTYVNKSPRYCTSVYPSKKTTKQRKKLGPTWLAKNSKFSKAKQMNRNGEGTHMFAESKIVSHDSIPLGSQNTWVWGRILVSTHMIFI